MSTVLARGPKVFEKIRKLTIKPYRRKLQYGNKVIYIKPMTQFKSERNVIIFLTFQLGQVYFYQSIDNTLRVEYGTPDFERRIELGALTSGGLSASAFVTAYKAMVYFGLALTPGGKWIKKGVNFTSIANFWTKHSTEIYQSIELLKSLVTDLKVIYRHYPTLSALMLSVALQQSYENIIKQKRQKGGWFALITSNIGLDTAIHNFADFFGAYLKSKLFPSGSWIGRKLKKMGFKRLAYVAAQVHGYYKKYKLFQKGKRAVTPSIENVEVLIAQFMTVFAQAGVKIQENEKNQIAKEISRNPKHLQRLQSVSTICVKFEDKITRLSKAANKEIFLPI